MTRNNEDLSISEAAGILTAGESNMLQFHVFKDDDQKKPIFAAFFILGEKGEAKEAIKEMTKLKDKWDSKARVPKVVSDGHMEVSYILQQIDTEGVYDASRKCDTATEFLQVMRQYGIKKIDDNHRIVKRVEVPIGIPSLKKISKKQK